MLTGELSGLVEGGRPANVTLFPNNPDFMSFLSSSDLQTNAMKLLKQTVCAKWPGPARDQNKVVEWIFSDFVFNAQHFSTVFKLFRLPAERAAKCNPLVMESYLIFI